MRLLFSLIICLFLFSCENKNTPDVSAVKVDLVTQRFDKVFFALDSKKIMPQLDTMLVEYPAFGKVFLIDILGVDPRWPNDSTAAYLNNYKDFSKTIYDTAQKYFNDFSDYEKQIKKSLQYVKYYFPKYKTPTKLITFLGPVDGSGCGIGVDYIAIGLQAHLGKDFPMYKTDMVRSTYPEYVTARFNPDYIPVAVGKTIVDDMFPEKNDDKRLLIQMIENGKRLYLLSKFLPNTEEYKLIGYTKEQFKLCKENEAVIWNFFIQSNQLQNADNNLIKNYVTDGPKTAEIDEKAPGNIGSYAGWQIVKKYATKFSDVKIDSIMKMDNEVMYQSAKYKP
jgi:hypothetical protein